MKTIEVPRWLFVLGAFSTVICVAAGCISILSWVVTGQPHPDWVTIRQPLPPAPPQTHQSLPWPKIEVNPDLIPATQLPTR